MDGEERRGEERSEEKRGGEKREGDRVSDFLSQHSVCEMMISWQEEESLSAGVSMRKYCYDIMVLLKHQIIASTELFRRRGDKLKIRIEPIP